MTIAVSLPLSAQSKPRARDLGIPFDGTPGALNAITDIPGVAVGFATLISRSSLPRRSARGDGIDAIDFFAGGRSGQGLKRRAPAL